MGNEDIEVRVAPPGPRYLLVDSTRAFDAAHFGENLERRFGGRNILDFLDDARNSSGAVENGRLDAGARYPFMPVYRVTSTLQKRARGAGGVVVMMPRGFNGEGLDEFWRTYAVDGAAADRAWEHPTWLSSGRQTACELSARTLQGFLQVAGVIVAPSSTGSGDVGHILTSTEEYFEQTGRILSAQLLFVSSHGYYGGFMRGDNIVAWASAQPASAALTYLCKQDDFLLGRAVKEGEGFWGPIWLIFAQCSTMNEATWPDWVRLFSKSHPPVRGALAYEDLSPDPGVAMKITESFFDGLEKGKSFVEAWKDANGTTRNWAAVVHKDAENDRIEEWPKLLANQVSGQSYKGFCNHFPSGTAISLAPPLLDVVLEHQGLSGNDWQPIESHTLDRPVGHVFAGHRYRVTVKLGNELRSKSESIEHLVVEFINSRPWLHDVDHFRTALSSVFEGFALDDPAGGGKLQVDGANLVFDRTPGQSAPLTSVTMSMRARSLFFFFTYLWPRVTAKLRGETVDKLRFPQIGLRDKLGLHTPIPSR